MENRAINWNNFTFVDLFAGIGGTVLEGVGLFFGLSIALVLFKIIVSAVMQAKEDRRNV